jgi:imidazolonepropionase-like amidohydrolase
MNGLMSMLLAAATSATPLPSVIPAVPGSIAVRGDTVYTMAGAPIADGVVLVRDGKIERVGRAAEVRVPAGVRTLRAKVVTPGLVDAHSTVGLTGYLNQAQDQDQLDATAPIQPELRAIDAYDPQERLIAWVRGFGITTVHTGHAPGALISGETLIAKTRGRTVDEAVFVPFAMVASTFGPGARPEGENKSPGTRPKMIAMLRAELIKAQEYAQKKKTAEKGKEPDRNLRYDALAAVLDGERPLLLSVQRANDIVTALRLADEFKLKLVLDGAAEAFLVVDRIKQAGVPVIVHPTMERAFGEAENLSFETPATLRKAGIPVALQSGFESYVPKTRVVLFEAAIAYANGLSLEEALGLVTIDAARLLGIEKRVGSLEAGKDGDLALYDGDPFEYTTHCVGTVIEGQVVSEGAQ